MPPSTQPALYQALLKIPGITVIPGAVNGTGRHGVGVTLPPPNEAEALIFTHAGHYLGERWPADSHDPGAVTTRTPIRAGLVNRVGERP